MNEYIVKIREISEQYVAVAANSFDEACEKAKEELHNGNIAFYKIEETVEATDKFGENPVSEEIANRYK